jgi:deoxyadenosine/deoxycytidine kinase
MDHDILRRIAERGRSLAVKEKHSDFTDLFQHMLDELERWKKYGQQTKQS